MKVLSRIFYPNHLNYLITLTTNSYLNFIFILGFYYKGMLLFFTTINTILRINS